MRRRALWITGLCVVAQALGVLPSRRRSQGPGEALRALETRSLDELEDRRLPRATAPVPAQAGLRTAQVPESRLHRPGARDQPDAGGRGYREDPGLLHGQARHGQARALPRHQAAALCVLVPSPLQGERVRLRLQPHPRRGHAGHAAEPGFAIPDQRSNTRERSCPARNGSSSSGPPAGTTAARRSSVPTATSTSAPATARAAPTSTTPGRGSTTCSRSSCGSTSIIPTRAAIIRSPRTTRSSTTPGRGPRSGRSGSATPGG